MKSLIIFLYSIFFCYTLYPQSDKKVVEIDNPIGIPVFKSMFAYVQKNDSIFVLEIFPSSEKQIDSIRYTGGFSTKLTKRKWISYQSDGSYIVKKYRKVRKSSEWFNKYNRILFQADSELICTNSWTYDVEGNLIYKFWRFGTMTKAKRNSMARQPNDNGTVVFPSPLGEGWK